MYEHFKKGVNLGGWLSQFDLQETGKLNEEQRIQHFGSFITEEDIKRLKEWGADHVRLPFISDIVDQYPEYMDRCVDWCEKYDLGIILDLHEIEGHGYMANGEIPRILTDERLINRCVFIWTTLAKRYLNRKNPAMVFELINEIHDPVSYYWKEFYKRLVEEIRVIDKERVILIGTTEANSPFRFAELDVLDDPNIVYNFHFYDPVSFTHQLAPFSEEMMKYNRKIHYPGEIPDFIDFVKDNRQWCDRYTHTEWDTYIDRSLILKYLNGVFEFVNHTGKEVYCGEYGVVDEADMADRIAWIRDFQEILEEHHIGRAYWNYKIMNFGLVDRSGKVIDDELRKTVFNETGLPNNI